MDVLGAILTGAVGNGSIKGFGRANWATKIKEALENFNDGVTGVNLTSTLVDELTPDESDENMYICPNCRTEVPAADTTEHRKYLPPGVGPFTPATEEEEEQ